jgi:PmbA protein
MPLCLVEKGLLRSYYCDLLYARKLGALPTGHGYKTAMWGGEVVSFMPTPSLQHLTLGAGDRGLSEMISTMDRGIVVGQALGAHSGNIPNGDYSIGLAPGFYVERGEIVGRVKDAMASGNIYESLGNISAVENRLHHVQDGRYPAVLIEDASVAAQ